MYVQRCPEIRLFARFECVPGGKGIPEKLLFDIYASIRAKPLVVREGNAESSSENSGADGAMLEFVECPICQKPVSHALTLSPSHHSAPISAQGEDVPRILLEYEYKIYLFITKY